eukprot:CAMPEP_0197627950 /NCGR_PEP_ID=MMETSP1338-20131121/6415_1 /TAXON_ID=43686 ORGANISM="Pelagodinium beii, Strain RCC1491" /NCGR_SAMPLE_ID=MMETSP1338 /ASSEMBLY_ACC=CAM_ASM_000754 /LENGTH=503 /DNA_ID=CAMNT_0043198805 /DNA_START=107 /DNA_END=1618 /DNA_ORIENTATION=-
MSGTIPLLEGTGHYNSKDSRRCPRQLCKLKAGLLFVIALTGLFLAKDLFCERVWGNVGSPYKKVQYLGLSIFTVPGTAADGCFHFDRAIHDSCYLGKAELFTDLERRKDIILEAIEKAYASSAWDRNSSTLKVVMAPEFFWRGPKGAYQLGPELAKSAAAVFGQLQKYLSDKRFSDCIFVLGTVVAVRLHNVHPELLNLSKGTALNSFNVSYYNFAPIHVGGEDTMLVHFKHHVSTIDFLHRQKHLRPGSVIPNPIPSSCQHRGHQRCSYGKLSSDKVQRMFGFSSSQVVQDEVFIAKGLRIGIEICLDHLLGTLANSLGPSKTVDLHLIVSAGMRLAAGPICTRQGGPAFLADGYARTAMTMNIYGQGRQAGKLPGGGFNYNIGVVYAADPLLALGQWLGDTIEALTGTQIGVAPIGFGILPEGIPFSQVQVFDNMSVSMLEGFYPTANFEEARHIYSLILSHVEEPRKRGFTFGDVPNMTSFFPTVDVYGPILLPERSWFA